MKGQGKTLAYRETERDGKGENGGDGEGMDKANLLKVLKGS